VQNGWNVRQNIQNRLRSIHFLFVVHKKMSEHGLGVGGARRHRRVLRDNIQGITKDAILRIAFKAGVKSLTGLMYEELRSVIKVWLEGVIAKASAYQLYYRKKTVNEGMASAALAVTADMFGWVDPSLKVSVCKPRSRVTGETNPALRSIRYHQSQYGCLVIPPTVFQRLAKELLLDYSGPEQDRFTQGALTLLQYATELYCVKILQDANLIAIGAGRQSLQPRDLQLARRIKHY